MHAVCLFHSIKHNLNKHDIIFTVQQNVSVLSIISFNAL